MIEDDVFRITIPLDKVAVDEGREQKTEFDISRATVFRDYAKIKK